MGGGFDRTGEPGKQAVSDDIHKPSLAPAAPGKRTLADGVEVLRHGPDGTGVVQRKPVDAPAPGAATASAHAAPAHQVAERDGLNAVITVVARGPDGSVLARWRARGHWDGPLPARYHGSRAPAAWTWSDPAARETRLHTRADGTGGELVERWAAQHGSVTVDVVASAIGDAGPEDEGSDAHADPAGAPGPAPATTPAGGAAAAAAGPERGANTAQLLAAFWSEIDAADAADLRGDDEGGHGAAGGDPHGRIGEDTRIGGTGPGGSPARSDGDHEGSETHGAVDGSRHGSALGVEGGSAGGRFGGEGKPADQGVRGAGAIAGGVIAIPEAIKGAVELLLLADAGDVTGAGANAFKALGKEVAGLGATALRELVAREAREVCRREIEAAVERLASSPQWLALSTEEQMRTLRIVYYENMRGFFRGFSKAAKDAERSATRALRGAAGARKVAAQETMNAARVGTEAAEVEPVAGRLPRNHEFAGGEFPRERLPPKYQQQGLKFDASGHPDFEPYAYVLPNGRKTVTIELTGSRPRDFAAANRAAGLKRTPIGYTWEHLPNEGEMMLVPKELHQIGHTGGVASFKDRTGLDYE